MRIGFLSDAHGNLSGFQTGLRLLESENVDDVWFLGDAVGYLPCTDVVLELQRLGINTIRGNHEQMLLQGGLSREKESVYRLEEIGNMLSTQERSFLAEWPDHVRLKRGDCHILLVHGSPSDKVFGYVYPDTALDDYFGECADVICMGNTHYPFVRREGGKLFINVGSCGMPRGSDRRGAVAILDVNTRSAEILHYPLNQSAKAVLDNMQVHRDVQTAFRKIAEYENDE